MRLVLSGLALVALLVSTIALAHSDGIYNPAANSVGSFEGIDSNKPASSSPFSLTFQSSAGVAGSGTTANMGTMSYGSSNSRVVVGISWVPAAAETISGITINGVACTQVTGAFANTGSTIGSTDIWVSNTAVSGTSGNVTVTFSGTVSGAGVAVALYNLITNTPAAADAQHNTVLNGTPVAKAVNVPASGVAIAITASQSGNTANTWMNVTADVTVTPPPFSTPVYFAHTTTTGLTTVTATYAGNAFATLSLASWGP